MQNRLANNRLLLIGKNNSCLPLPKALAVEKNEDRESKPFGSNTRNHKISLPNRRSVSGRRFTPDGHLVGSIGEILAAHYYGLELLPNSFQNHDAKAFKGQLVQIKVTQRTTVALRYEPNYLIVLLLKKDGTFEEVYNGPGKNPWENAGKMQKNGQRPISLSKLRTLMETVPILLRIPLVGNQPVSSGDS